MSKRTREIRKVFRITPEEEKQIELNMEHAGLNCFSKYAREMLIKGEVKVISQFEAESIKKLLSEYGRVGTNINQIARVANSSRKVYRKELEELLTEKQIISDCFREVLRIHQDGAN